MTASSPQVRLTTQAGAVALNLRVGGIPGIPHGETIKLSTDDGKWSVQIDRNNPEFATFDFPPGSLIVASISLTRSWLEQVVPDDLALPSRGLILPSKAN